MYDLVAYSESGYDTRREIYSESVFVHESWDSLKDLTDSLAAYFIQEYFAGIGQPKDIQWLPNRFDELHIFGATEEEGWEVIDEAKKISKEKFDKLDAALKTKKAEIKSVQADQERERRLREYEKLSKEFTLEDIK